MSAAAKITLPALQAGGTVATMLAPTAFIPVIGPAVAGAGVLLSMIFSRKRGRQKVAATEIVNQLAPVLQQNLDGYLSGPRTPESQAQALANFDSAWAWLTSPQACGNQELGDPGHWCINDRARGGKFDWFQIYRDPIANDTQVKKTRSVIQDGAEVNKSLMLPLAITLIVAGAAL